MPWRRSVSKILTCAAVAIVAAVVYWELNGPHMRSTTLYDSLKVSRDATQDTIATAYRGLSLKYHPDKTTSLAPEAREASTRLFHDVSNAYSILSNPQSRYEYDRELAHKATEPASLWWWPHGLATQAASLSTWVRLFAALGLLTALHECLVRPVGLWFSGERVAAAPIATSQKDLARHECILRLQQEYDARQALANRRRRN
ncbi:hypothetical protein AaE_004748 [Aphanomyces astaci]|uniref:J domain-containing protein n=1 Tax=Aphanomyces astaci TaxID=112090 RepID=A0A6A5AQV3_APHAT|nr:hypothetical protein AaE_004748 [Aphanomyces astaci]